MKYPYNSFPLDPKTLFIDLSKVIPNPVFGLTKALVIKNACITAKIIVKK